MSISRYLIISTILLFGISLTHFLVAANDDILTLNEKFKKKTNNGEKKFWLLRNPRFTKELQPAVKFCF